MPGCDGQYAESGSFPAASGGELADSEPNCAQEREEGDESLGDDAVETPDLENIALNMREIEGEGQAGEGGDDQKKALAREGKDCQEKVAGDPDGGDRDVVDDGERAVIDDAAVPACVDGAGLGRGGVVHLKSQGGNDDAGEGQESKENAHRVVVFQSDDITTPHGVG